MEDSERGRTILAVDDERLVLTLLKSTLEKGGFSVLTADNGREALKILSGIAAQVDLVITDVVMPEMDGTALAEMILKLRPNMPLLFISGFSDRLAQIKAPILAKPFSSTALLGKVRSLLRPDARMAGG